MALQRILPLPPSDLMLFTFLIDNGLAPQFFKELEVLKRIHGTTLPNLSSLPELLHVQPLSNGTATQPVSHFQGIPYKPTVLLEQLEQEEEMDQEEPEDAGSQCRSE